MVLTNGQLPLYATAGSGMHQQVIGPPVASGDFTNIATSNAADGDFTLNGAPCTLDDIIDVNSEWASGPVTVDEDGIVGDGCYLAMKDPLRAQLLAGGFTVVIEGYMTFTANLRVDVLDISDNAYFDYNQGETDYAADLGVNSSGHDDYAGASVWNTIHKFAVTMAGDHMAVSIDGAAPHVSTRDGLYPAATDVVIMLDSDIDARLRSFTFYEPVDDADLPTLSDLG